MGIVADERHVGTISNSLADPAACDGSQRVELLERRVALIEATGRNLSGRSSPPRLTSRWATGIFGSRADVAGNDLDAHAADSSGRRRTRHQRPLLLGTTRNGSARSPACSPRPGLHEKSPRARSRLLLRCTGCGGGERRAVDATSTWWSWRLRDRPWRIQQGMRQKSRSRGRCSTTGIGT